jgi:hypothetical protein
MSRVAAMGRAQAYFDDGGFVADLGRRVAIESSSQEPSRANACLAYLRDEIAPALALLGFTNHILVNPLGPTGPGGGASRGSGCPDGTDLWPR